MSLRIVVRDHLKPECREEALKLLREMVECTRKEEGCILYQYSQDIHDPDYYLMIEYWESEELMQKHCKSEHFCRIFPQLEKMFAEPSRVEFYKEVF